MGQYYKPTILKKERTDNETPIKAQLSPYDFGNGAKLMEHSYVRNRLVQAAEYLLAQDKEGVPFVWSGDYAENFENRENNLYSIGGDKLCEETIKTMPLIEKDGWMYKEYSLDPSVVKVYKYVINHTKKLFVEIPPFNEDYPIHPLPLLTAESNGLGGGDYWGKVGADLVGSWKYDTISVGDEVPSGFEELKVQFKED